MRCDDSIVLTQLCPIADLSILNPNGLMPFKEAPAARANTRRLGYDHPLRERVRCYKIGVRFVRVVEGHVNVQVGYVRQN